MIENPIDIDKVAENPGLLPYAHTVGSAVIKPEDKGKIKGRALLAMSEQTEKQLQQIHEQIQLLAIQAKAIQKRVWISEKIYESEMGFEPLIGHEYSLYERHDGSFLLSLVPHNSWGRSFPFKQFCARVKLLSDHTWEVLEQGENFEV
jgi:predicted transcriptional regulator